MDCPLPASRGKRLASRQFKTKAGVLFQTGRGIQVLFDVLSARVGRGELSWRRWTGQHGSPFIARPSWTSQGAVSVLLYTVLQFVSTIVACRKPVKPAQELRQTPKVFADRESGEPTAPRADNRAKPPFDSATGSRSTRTSS